MGETATIQFNFERDADYRLIPVNGVWGGTTARGDIKVDFFYESAAVPEEVTGVVGPDGVVSEERVADGPLEMQRTIFVGMMLTAEQADSIGRWLQEKALQSRGLREGKGDEPSSVTTH